MKVYEVIAAKVEEKGMNRSELARRIGIDPELLRRSLKGDRKLQADELVSISEQLGLSLDDYRQ